MPFPFKYNPVRVLIKQINTSQTVLNQAFGNVVGNIKYLTPVEIKAQVNLWKKQYHELLRTQAGDEKKIRGKLVIAKYDYTTPFKKGDKILEFGPIGTSIILDAIVTEVRPESPLNGDFLLYIIDFEEDRSHHGLKK